MTFVAADWTITRATQAIRYIGDAHAGASPSYATGIELHRALSDFNDDSASSGDDELSIIDEVPSRRGGVDTNIILLNGYNIDQLASEHLYDTSVTQSNGDEIYDGIQVFGNAASIQVIQNGAVIASDFWNEANMVAVTADAASNTTHRFLILVRTAAADVDGRRLIGTQRVLGTQYTEFAIGGGTNRGNNVLALNAIVDPFNGTAEGTISGWNDIVNDNEGYSQIDVDGDSVNENYYSDWEFGSRSNPEFYERMKWLSREGSASTLYGLNGELFRGITHQIVIDTPTGTFVEPESVSWSGGAGQLLAIDSTTAGTVMWIQLLTGSLPSDNDTITGNGGGTADVNVTITARTISTPFVGISTGSAILGSYGIGIGVDDLVVSDSLIALDNVVRNPQNNVTFDVNGTVVGEDYVVVASESAGDIEFNQLGLNATLNSSVTTIVMDSVIPTDTPGSGTIRVLTDAGEFIRVPYDSYTGSTFTIPSFDFSGSNVSTAGNNVFVTYVDRLSVATTESFTTVFASVRSLIVRVRDGGITPIVPIQLIDSLGSGGGSVTLDRQSDL